MWKIVFSKHITQVKHFKSDTSSLNLRLNGVNILLCFKHSSCCCRCCCSMILFNLSHLRERERESSRFFSVIHFIQKSIWGLMTVLCYMVFDKCFYAVWIDMSVGCVVVSYVPFYTILWQIDNISTRSVYISNSTCHRHCMNASFSNLVVVVVFCLFCCFFGVALCTPLFILFPCLARILPGTSYVSSTTAVCLLALSCFFFFQATTSIDTVANIPYQ